MAQNIKRERESLLIAAQKNPIWTNGIQAIIHKKQQNSKSRLCSDKDEMINHISECSKLAQKEYKTKRDWVGKLIHWDMCKKLRFDSTNKRYMHNPASVLENDTHKLRWDFSIQTDYLISAIRPDIIINKAAPANHRIKLKQTWKKDKYLNLSRELKKSSNMKVIIIPIVISWCPWCNGYRRRKWTRRHEFKSWTRLIAFHIALIPLGKVWIQLFPLQLWVNSRED